jgi:hypothetical protein
MKKILTAIIAIVLTYGSYADDSESAPITRRGFVIGAGIGGGVLISADHADPQAYAKMSLLNLKLGYMITPSTELCLHLPSGGHRENKETRAFEAVLAGGKHWFSERFWGLAAAGLAMDMPPFYDYENDDPEMHFGFAAGLGTGYDIIRKRSCALDVQIRYLYGNCAIDGSRRQYSAVDLLVGFNWYPANRKK